MRGWFLALLTRTAGRLSLAVALLVAAVPAGCAGGRGEAPAGEETRVAADSAEAAGVDRARRAAADRRVERARVLLSDGEPRRAAAAAEMALRIDPAHGGAYLVLARARLALGEEERVRGLLERAAELLRAEGSPAAARADSLLSALEGGG